MFFFLFKGEMIIFGFFLPMEVKVERQASESKLETTQILVTPVKTRH